MHYNIKVEEYISALMLFAAAAIFIWAHKRRSPGTPLLFYCPVAFLTLTLAQWQNTIWGFQMAWYLVLLSLALTIFLLDWPRLAWPIFALAISMAVVGSFSSRQGLFAFGRWVWCFCTTAAVGCGRPSSGSLLQQRRRDCISTTSPARRPSIPMRRS